MSYKHKFCSLQEAVVLIADRLAGADQNNNVEPAVALRDAKSQLLRALFEGAVRSEGVSWEVVPQEYRPPSIEYDQWIPIDRGTWLHERCEESDHVYRLDSIEVDWYRNEISYFDSDGYWGECGERKIRLCCADLDREFPAQETTARVSVPADAQAGSQHRTGTAGRPSPKYLAEREMQRRANQGMLCSELAAEMRALCLWLKQDHPDAPPVKSKSLGNSLRHQYRKLKSSVNLPGEHAAQDLSAVRQIRTTPTKAPSIIVKGQFKAAISGVSHVAILQRATVVVARQEKMRCL